MNNHHYNQKYNNGVNHSSSPLSSPSASFCRRGLLNDIYVRTKVADKNAVHEEKKQKYFESLKKKLIENLAHFKPIENCPLTKKEIFDLGQLQKEENFEDSIHEYGIKVEELLHNAAPPILYEKALLHEPLTFISSTGALCCNSGEKTGRSPADKRIVFEESSCENIWWGKVNIKISEKSYLTNRERALDYLNIQERLYIVDAYAGWDEDYRIKVRVITTRAYHALFMQNMLVLPTEEELADFKPEFVIYNAGCFPANRYTEGVTSQTSVSLHFGRGEMVILGSQYAGEMKKGILTLMMYRMPLLKQLPLHSSCNVGIHNLDVTLFFGLSGTGKTTLSADPQRLLIGDDEHVWTEKGVFNIEGGCYAKCINLSYQQEPDIFNAIKFGSVLENVVIDSVNRTVDYCDTSLTENTRASYPLCYIPNAKIPAIIDTHPSNIILLTCDAFGVLPPVSRLSINQAMYYFISGYTSKMAGTEDGIYEPTATFSACFGAPFLAMHPMTYATLLAEKLEKHRGDCDVWQINTGWIGGGFGSKKGRRIPLKYTRKMIDAIHSGKLKSHCCSYEVSEVFRLEVPTAIEGVPIDILHQKLQWIKNDENSADELFQLQLKKLAKLFIENFQQYCDQATPEVINAGPLLN